MEINNMNPGHDLYLRVRAGFVAQGSSLSTFCRSRSINPTNAKAALVGVWNGPKGRQVRAELVKAASFEQSCSTQAVGE